MLIPVKDTTHDACEAKWEDEVDQREELERAWSDILRNANTGMMSWAEKNFRQKCIDILYHMRYYKYNQTIYLKHSKKGDKESE